MRSIGMRARSAVAGGTRTSGARSRRESRSLGSVIIFMYWQTAIRDTGMNRLPGFCARSGYSIPVSVATMNSVASDSRAWVPRSCSHDRPIPARSHDSFRQTRRVRWGHHGTAVRSDCPARRRPSHPAQQCRRAVRATPRCRAPASVEPRSASGRLQHGGLGRGEDREPTRPARQPRVGSQRPAHTLDVRLCASQASFAQQRAELGITATGRGRRLGLKVEVHAEDRAGAGGKFTEPFDGARSDRVRNHRRLRSGRRARVQMCRRRPDAGGSRAHCARPHRRS